LCHIFNPYVQMINHIFYISSYQLKIKYRNLPNFTLKKNFYVIEVLKKSESLLSDDCIVLNLNEITSDPSEN